jgi:hypothetical protein
MLNKAKVVLYFGRDFLATFAGQRPPILIQVVVPLPNLRGPVRK